MSIYGQRSEKSAPKGTPEPPNHGARSSSLSVSTLRVAFALAFAAWWVGLVASVPFFDAVSARDTVAARAAFSAVTVASVAAIAVLSRLGWRGMTRFVLGEAAGDFLDIATGSPSEDRSRQVARLRRVIEKLPPSAQGDQEHAWKVPTRGALWTWGFVFYPAWLAVTVVAEFVSDDRVQYWREVRLEVLGASAAVAAVVVAARTIARVRRAGMDFGDSLAGTSTVAISGLVIAEVVVNTRRELGGWLGRLLLYLRRRSWLTTLLILLAFLYLVAAVIAWSGLSTSFLNALIDLTAPAAFFVWLARRSARRASRKGGAGSTREEA